MQEGGRNSMTKATPSSWSHSSAGWARVARFCVARLRALMFFLLLACACARQPVEVTLLSLNDFHGALGDGGLEPGSGRPWGGALALAAEVRLQRQLRPRRTFLLDAGDDWQGTPESNFSFGRTTVGYLDRLGVDVAAIGNHEFDWGIDTLRARIGEARYPMLAANVFEKSGKKPEWARGHAVLERDGVKLGVIGFITPETPKVTTPQNVASLHFPPPEEQVDSLVTLVRAEGADLVVLLCHLGAWQDSSGVITGPLADLARRARGVDAIVGGHIHGYVAGEVAGIPLVTAGTKGRALGRIVLRWNGRRVVGAEAAWIAVHADSLPMPPDAAVAAFVDSVQRATAPLVSQVWARAARRLDEEALAAFIAAAMQERVGADVAVTNLGGVRTEFEAGAITEGDVFELVPFENTLVTARLRGDELAAFAASNPAEARLAGARRCAGGALCDEAGRRLAAEKEFLVVTNSFLAQGGDGFQGFLSGRDLEWTEHRVRDVVRDAIVAAHRGGFEAVSPQQEPQPAR